MVVRIGDDALHSNFFCPALGVTSVYGYTQSLKESGLQDLKIHASTMVYLSEGESWQHILPLSRDHTVKYVTGRFKIFLKAIPVAHCNQATNNNTLVTYAK